MTALSEKKVLKISVGNAYVVALGENKTSLDVSIPSKLMQNETEESMVITDQKKKKRKRRHSVTSKQDENNKPPSFRDQKPIKPEPIQLSTVIPSEKVFEPHHIFTEFNCKNLDQLYTFIKSLKTDHKQKLTTEQTLNK